MIADFCKIPIGNVKKFVPKFYDNEDYVLHYENLHLSLKLALKLKKNTLCIRIQSVTVVKITCRI